MVGHRVLSACLHRVLHHVCALYWPRPAHSSDPGLLRQVDGHRVCRWSDTGYYLLLLVSLPCLAWELDAVRQGPWVRQRKGGVPRAQTCRGTLDGFGIGLYERIKFCAFFFTVFSHGALVGLGLNLPAVP